MIFFKADLSFTWYTQNNVTCNINLCTNNVHQLHCTCAMLVLCQLAEPMLTVWLIYRKL